MALKEMLGIRFDKLVVVERAPNKKDGTATWVCLCDCGISKNVPGTKLRAGKQKSCGCASPKFTKVRMTTHGKSKNRTYKIWAGMKRRCSTSAKGKSKLLYFDKGIRVCNEWLDFKNFFEDMGEAPEGLTIDRIDGEKDYCFTNCRWATYEQQANNTTRNKFIEHNGKKMTIAHWAKELNIKPNTLTYRIRRKMPTEQALNSLQSR
jgi:hypothetical protein